MMGPIRRSRRLQLALGVIGALLLVMACFVWLAATRDNRARIALDTKEQKAKLRTAAEKGHLNLLTRALTQGADPESSDEDGLTLLHYAALGNCPKSAELLLTTGARLEARTKQGRTPLSLACGQGYLEVTKTLLAHNAALATADRDGLTPLHYAVRGEDLLEAYREDDPVRAGAVAPSSPDIRRKLCTLLLDKGAPIEAHSVRGWTPLHIAASLGKAQAVSLLLAYGADPNAADAAGLTPLHHAAGSHNAEVVSQLLRQGADPFHEDALGWMPADHAAFEGDSKSLALLPTRGLSSKETPLVPVKTTAAHSKPIRQAKKPSSRVPARPPNVLLLVIDALRPDRLHCYGNARTTSPNIDRLAQDGVLLSDVMAAGSRTAHTVPILLTGQSPGARGLDWKEMQWGLTPIPGDSCPTLAEIFKGNNYATCAVTANPLVGTSLGVKKGFDQFYKSPAQGKVWLRSQAKEVNASAVSWLRQLNSTAPFFLYLHYLEPHNLYVPPMEYTVFGRPGYTARDDLINQLADALADAADDNGQQLTNTSMRAAGLSARDLQRLRELYDDEILCVDYYLGRLFAALQELGQYENTIIIVTADHGEAFLEHGSLKHGAALYQETTSIPLIIAGPGIQPGIRKQDLVAQVDIAPTILKLAGIQQPVAMSGVNFLQAFRGKGTSNAKLVVSEIPEKAYAIREGSLKLIVTGNAKELYDLSRDPAEKMNLAKSRPADVRRLNDRYQALMRRRERRTVRTSSPTKDQLKALKSLGYLK
jgi:arylsulfatase A-like enzyme/ankyrin repeat protein